MSVIANMELVPGPPVQSCSFLIPDPNSEAEHICHCCALHKRSVPPSASCHPQKCWYLFDDKFQQNHIIHFLGLRNSRSDYLWLMCENLGIALAFEGSQKTVFETNLLLVTVQGSSEKPGTSGARRWG